VIENLLFPPEEVLRYSRHIILPEVGPAGQQKIRNSKVLIVGAGGLGSPVALYLAAAGVGRIGLIDFDRVDLSNLQRQVIHTKERVGMLKVDSAAKAINELNSHVVVDKITKPLDASNALEIIGNYDLVIDGTDNFPTRYLINDACVQLGKPFVYGSIYRFEGHVSVFGAKNEPCYRCLFPEPPSSGLAPSCSEAGVLGVLAGTIGTLQATEALKLILGIGESLAGYLLVYDALNMQFRKLKANHNQKCPVCGQNPTITSLDSYIQECADDLIHVSTITPKDFIAWHKEKKPMQIIDVRETHQRLLGTIFGSIETKIDTIATILENLDSTKPTIVVCQLGVRSKVAIGKLRELGFGGELLNLDGGVLALSQEIV
jgi:adenylyltransferase/sulfurtransferase